MQDYLMDGDRNVSVSRMIYKARGHIFYWISEWQSFCELFSFPGDPSDAHLLGQFSRKACKSRLSHQQQVVIRFDRPLPKQICQSELLRFASQVAEDQTSNAMEDVSCLRPKAESRVPPAPTRRSTILDLVSQSGDLQTGSLKEVQQ